MTHAGALSVWSGRYARQSFHPFTDELVLGRELADPSDDRISRRHARVIKRDDVFEVEDLGSRNGTYVDGHTLHARRQFVAPFVIRTGRSVFAIVDDLRPYLDRPHDDAAAREEALEPIVESEDCVLFVGPGNVPRQLAQALATARGGEVVSFDACGPRNLEGMLASGRPRTLILENPDGLAEEDIATLATWLETDLCVATCVRRARDLRGLPPAIVQRLTLREMAVPEVRFDSIARALSNLVKLHAPGAWAHASTLEASLLVAFDLDEGRVVEWLDHRVRAFAGCREEVMRPHHLGVPPTFPADRVIWPGMRITWRRKR